jgi:predicted nucleic acid-binding protein
VLICDTSGLVAFFDASDKHHPRVSNVIARERGPFIVSPFVLAELDYLMATRRDLAAELAVLTELSGGAWELPAFTAEDLRSARDIVERYGDLDVGLADASQVVLAARYRTQRILTLDRRHFGVVRTAKGKPFTLLPD